MSEEIVQRAMRQMPQAPQVPHPDPKRIWWLAEIRRRQEARLRTMQIMTRIRIGATAVVFGIGCAIAVWQGTDLPGLTWVAAAAFLSAAVTGLRVVLAKE